MNTISKQTQELFVEAYPGYTLTEDGTISYGEGIAKMSLSSLQLITALVIHHSTLDDVIRPLKLASELITKHTVKS